MEATDYELKNNLRKDKIMYDEYIELLEAGDYEKLMKKFKQQVARIEASLQD